MTHRLDTLATELLAELKTVQAGVDAIAARKRVGREVPQRRYSPMTGEVDRLAHALRQISQGGQAADYAPDFGAALNAFEVKHDIRS